MTKRGYERKFVLGLLAAGGTLGILIPPSIILIVYGVITEESITRLFLAGIGPGLFLAFAFSAYAMLYARFKGQYERAPKASWEERRKSLLRAFPALLLAFVIIFGIYFGIFTPTEAAGIGFVSSLIITTAMGRMDIQKLRVASVEAASTTVTIFVIVAGADIFAKAITLYRIPHDVSQMVGSTFTEPGMFILLVCIVLLIMGFFIEALSMMLVMVPVLYPSLLGMGIDPIWFGIVFVIMVECALITPPVGLNLFVLQAIAKVSLGEVSRGVAPFIVIMLSTVVLLFFWPDLALYFTRL